MARKKFGFSFSAKRALGISAAKGKVSQKTGIPLSKSGRQRKVGRAAGCCIPLMVYVGASAVFAAAVVMRFVT